MHRQGNKKTTVVVIDDDEAARVSIGQMLRLRSYDVKLFSSAEAALAWPELPDADCVVTDVKMPGMDGEELLGEILRRGYPPPVIMITGHGDISMAVRCLKAGVYDFVEKPFEDAVLLASVRRAVEKTALRRESEDLKRRLTLYPHDEDERFGMIAKSRVMQDVFAQIEVVARSDAPVLVHGETGVGKELVARGIHEQSPRAKGPFVAVNAGALPENMLESELFGHARGAFTGADSARDGKMVIASGGTLLLDEVESISVKAQLQSLRVLDDGQVYPLGMDTPRSVNVRLLATTKVDLQEQVRLGRMREDFFHRIVVLSIHIPPLRERVEDIPLLASHFLKLAAARNGIPVPKVPEQTLGAMLRHSWPGNVRELKHAVERMVITSRDGITGPFSAEEDFNSSRLLSLPSSPGRLHDELLATEKRIIEAVLRETGGEINTTSMTLGISRRALYERMKKYGLNKDDFRE
ncbi:MAG: sigma-54 dependent transcriptional regulator [Deltaproteobacteria bacterium]|nr:sigma-54 dependent transcriptional regulator [Deltaproteobacteria bacterium]